MRKMNVLFYRVATLLCLAALLALTSGRVLAYVEPASPLPAVAALNMEAVGHYGGQAVNFGRSGMVAAWQAAGKTYALINGSTVNQISDPEVIIFDVTEPANPQPVKTIAAAGLNFPSHLVMQGNLIYMTTMAGLQVLDVSNPLEPSLRGSIAIPTPHRPVMQGSRVYVPAGVNGVYIIDVSNPDHLVQLGLIPMFLSPPVPLVTQVEQAAVRDNWLYFTEGAFLRIFNVTNPQSPQPAGLFALRSHGDSLTLAEGPQAGQRFVYVYENELGGLEIVDVSNPEHPVAAGFQRTPTTVSMMVMQGDLMYLANMSAGVRVWDIQQRAAPREIAYFIASEAPVDVALFNGLIYAAADIMGPQAWPGGLDIFRLSFSVSGQILQANELPFSQPGIQISASNGISTTTDTTGAFTLTRLTRASRLTLTPSLAGYRFWPATGAFTVTVRPGYASFVALPAGQSMVVSPSAPANLDLVDTQGLATTLTAGSAAVTETVSVFVTPTLATAPLGFGFAGHAFEVEVQKNGGALPNFTFSQPLTATIHFSAQDVGLVTNLADLQVRRWNGGIWEPINGVSVDVVQRIVNFTISRAGTYALFGPTRQMFLPMVSFVTY